MALKRGAAEIEAVTLRVAGDDSRGAAENFDDIGVGHERFLPLASVKSHKDHLLKLIAPASPPGTSSQPKAIGQRREQLGAIFERKR
jgi:hypothetical protein